jgi:hypothetical protein
MLLRLLSLLCLLCLSQASLTQQESATARPEAVPETCPVTKVSDNPFVPPHPYHAKTMSGGSWFGTDGLWIAPPADGIWGGQHFSTTDPASGSKTDWWREAKVSWWRQGYDWRVDSASKLKVTGRRLDSTAPPLVAHEANAVGIKFPNIYMMDSLYFPTPGCWEITGRYEDDEVTFVVWVAK